VPGRLVDYGDIIGTGSGGTKEAFRRIQSPLELRRAVQTATTEGLSSAASHGAHATRA